MSNDETESEDLIPYTAPAPVFNDSLPEGKPAVPELSVLLDQDKIQSFHSNHPPMKLNEHDFILQSEMSKQKSSVVTGKDKTESYNTWKARHADELNMITSSSRKTDSSSKQYSKKPSESKFNSSSSNGAHSGKRNSSVSSSPNVEMHRQNMQNYAPQHRSHFQGKDQPNFTQDGEFNLSHRPTSNPYGNIPSREYYQLDNLPRYGENIGLNDQNRYFPQDLNGQVLNVNGPSGLIHSKPPNGYQSQATSNCNQDKALHPNPGHQYYSGGVRNPLPGVLSDNQISSQAVQELYQVIQLQNQQMSTAIMMLQQQVNQLQLSISAEKSVGGGKDVCKNCSCSQSTSDKSLINISSSPKRKVGKDSSNKKIQVSPKRSVGVMANITECDEEESSETSDVAEESVNRKQSKPSSKHREKQTKQVAKKTSTSKEKKSPKISEEPKVLKAKKMDNSPQEKKLNKKQSMKCRSTNLPKELKHVRNETEADEESTNEDCDTSDPSIHINLQDYTSSDNSDSDLRSGSENSDSLSESVSEEESSAPKLGWTFYNQIVDQVNNIVKKTPAPPKNDRSSGSKKVLPSRRKEEYDMENNWSKRVTFHGPPPSSSDDFMMNMLPNTPHFQPILGNQEYRDYQTTGPPERMQDLRMYNVANGNTNMSFTTLRYLERFDLLPPQFNSKRQDQTHQPQEYQQPRNCDMKQKKLHPDGYQSSHRRRTRDSRR